jgi:hypothetical protein
MEQGTQTESAVTAKRSGQGYLFGVPMGDLGWFTSLLMSLASGFAAFFAGTFFAIVGLLVYTSVTGKAVDFALTYRRVGLPVGVVVLVVALAYMGTLWVRRQLRRA